MAKRTTPPFRADHVGSLLRPPQLMKAREDHAAGRIDDDELRGIEDEAIREVVRKQEDVGLQSATDGEFRRASWHMDFIYQLGGITTIKDDNLKVQFRNEQGEHRVLARGAARDRQGRPARADLRRRVPVPPASASSTATPKLTIPSPSMVHYRGGRAAVEESVYPGHGRLLERPHDAPTPTRSRRSATSAAPTCSSTTRASPTSTTPSSAR